VVRDQENKIRIAKNQENKNIKIPVKPIVKITVNDSRV
jgi:hypothetical protein